MNEPSEFEPLKFYCNSHCSVFTVAGTQTDVEAEKKVQVPSPEPKPRSKSPSESSYTESSSISETFNECVSEGQWLINKSDGEVADFPIDEGIFQILYQIKYQF